MQHVVLARPLAKYPVFNEFSKIRSFALGPGLEKPSRPDPARAHSMAGKTGLARTRFAHHCRKLTNLSPMGYLQQLRVEKAKRLLVGDRHTITGIAMDCGFASGAYFASVFRNQTQCSPREYRNATRKT